MRKNIKFAATLTGACFAVLAVAGYAQTVSASPLLTSSSTLRDLINGIIGILDSLVPLLIGAAIVVFLYGVLVFIAKASAGNAEGRREGINFMIFGIIGIAVMVSVWGLVTFVTATLGTSNVVPQFNGGTDFIDSPSDILNPDQIPTTA
jgi:hypothetical protein